MDRARANRPGVVLLASMIGTTVEFFDFYIYATAAVLVFPRLFFPARDPGAAVLASLATFGIAFVARPIGSAVFGHYGDRVGRKATLVWALGVMGASTVLIGCLPGYARLGLWAPLLLSVCRFGQGIGLGGEWGGAVLLAVENAPPEKRAWYGMFPQMGAPIGFFLSGGVFLLLSKLLTNAQFLQWGWRLPFLASAVLIGLGLWVRLSLTETPAFRAAMERSERVGFPVGVVVRRHGGALVAAVATSLTTFVLFYLMTVFALSWGTTAMGYGRERFLLWQMVAVVAFGLAIPLSALAAERGRRRVMMGVTVLIGLFGLGFAAMFRASPLGMLVVGLGLMGVTYGPLGTVISEMFPTAVRYTGASLAFSLAGILGASVAPYLATALARRYGLGAVGVYLAVAAGISVLGLMGVREGRGEELDAGLV